MKILLADDEDTIREIITLYLEKAGFTVLAAADGETAMKLETQEQPDLLILDIMLPKMNGLDICRNISRSVPVIFLTAKTTENDKIAGFSLGADDYITKPFSPREVVARVKAVLRRSGFTMENDCFQTDGLSVNDREKTVTANGSNLTLPPKEFDLLIFFMRHPKQTFSRDQLLTNVWGYDFTGDDRTVDATIKRLRQKLINPHYNYIHTIRGFGYRFEVVKK